MAKKSTRKKAPAAKAAPAPAKTVADVKQKASEVLEARNAELFRLLNESSEIIRAASFNEIQIHLQKEMTAQLAADKKALVEELVALKKVNAEHRAKVDALAKEKKKVATENQGYQKTLDKLSRDAESMGDKREKLKKEVAGLEKRSEALREDVERLQIIRKEYMERISKFRGMREDLIR